MRELLKNKKRVKSRVNQAIGFVKSTPCCVCSLEYDCDVKYKGTCPIYKELKARFSKIEEMEGDDG